MNNTKCKIAIAGILLILSGCTIADEFKVTQMAFVFGGSVHIHRTDVDWDITDGEDLEEDSLFYLDMKLRTAPLKDYYEYSGQEVDSDGPSPQWVGNSDSEWAIIDLTVETTHIYPEVSKYLCSKTTFEVGADAVISPEYMCSWEPSLCTVPVDKNTTKTSSRVNNDSCNDREDPPVSPILIDLGQDGFELGQRGVGVHFDLFATGTPIHMQWVAHGGNESFLVLDLNGNGVIDDGSELFGEGTQLIAGQHRPALNGYIALQQYDSQALGGNGDGMITAEDDVWSRLGLWTDANADGISISAEMSLLRDSGITELDLQAKKSHKTDDAGNLLKLWSWARNRSTNPQTKYQMVDVFFKQLHQD